MHCCTAQREVTVPMKFGVLFLGKHVYGWSDMHEKKYTPWWTQQPKPSKQLQEQIDHSNFVVLQIYMIIRTSQRIVSEILSDKNVFP